MKCADVYFIPIEQTLTLEVGLGVGKGVGLRVVGVEVG